MILLHWLSQVIQNTHTGKPLVGISLIGIELMFSEIYPRSTSDSNITEKNLMQLTGLKKNMKSCQIKESLNKPCQNSWGSRQDWSVPAFIKIFNHLKFLLDLRPIRIARQAVAVYGPLVPIDPILTLFFPHKYYTWNVVEKNIYQKKMKRP